MSPKFLASIVVLQVVTVVGVLALLLLRPQADSPPSTTALGNVDLAVVEEVLRGMEAKLEQLYARTETIDLQLGREPAQEAEEKQPPGSTVDQLVERIARLLMTAGGAGYHRELQLARRTRPEPDWGQVVWFRDALQRDDASAMKQLLLLDPASVVRMLGEPTRIQTDTRGRINFQYARDEDGDGDLEGLNVFFVQGLVVDVVL